MTYQQMNLQELKRELKTLERRASNMSKGHEADMRTVNEEIAHIKLRIYILQGQRFFD